MAAMNIAAVAVVIIGTGPVLVAVLGALAATMNGVVGGASCCLLLRPLLPHCRRRSRVHQGWHVRVSG